MGKRAEALAERIAEGHRELIAFVEALSEADWRTTCPNEEWTVGVVVHHVASMLPAELDLIKTLASGQPIMGVTPEVVDRINAQHAREYADCTIEETLDLLRRNSALLVSAVRELTDAELDQAAPVSLHWDTPLTTQYFIEDHPLSHAYDHLASIRAAVGSEREHH
jgi:hypothetical protein